MLDTFWIRNALKAVVLPPTGPLLLALLGVALQRRRPRVGRALATVGVASLLLLSVPAVADILVACLHSYPPFDPAQARTAQAIVILGGGTRRNAPEYGGDTLGTLTLERVRYGARIARATGLPVLVSGGAVRSVRTEAELMRDALQQEFGVPVRWAEVQSRNTHENAARSAEILRGAGVDRVVLVAHIFDMQRACAEFEAAGLVAIAAPTGGRSPNSFAWADVVPSMAGLHLSYYAVYELLGNLVRWVTGPR